MGGDETREVDWTHMVESFEYFWRNLHPIADRKPNNLSAPWLHLICSCLCQAASVTNTRELRLTSSISYREHPARTTLEWMGMISTTLFSIQTMLILEDTDQSPSPRWSLPTPSPPWPLRLTSEILAWWSVELFGKLITLCLVTYLLLYYLFELVLEPCLVISQLFTSSCSSPQFGYTPQKSDVVCYFYAQRSVTQSAFWGRGLWGSEWMGLRVKRLPLIGTWCNHPGQ